MGCASSQIPAKASQRPAQNTLLTSSNTCVTKAPAGDLPPQAEGVAAGSVDAVIAPDEVAGVRATAPADGASEVAAPDEASAMEANASASDTGEVVTPVETPAMEANASSSDTGEVVTNVEASAMDVAEPPSGALAPDAATPSEKQKTPVAVPEQFLPEAVLLMDPAEAMSPCGPMPSSSTALAGLAWPAFTGPSSEVIRVPKDWCDEGILVPHEAFRWLHKEIRKILAQFDPLMPGQGWKTDAFFDWLARYYVEAIHHHHDSEERIYNPAIVEKGGSLPLKISSDHQQILAHLGLVSTFRARIRNAEEGAVEEFKTHMTRMIDEIEDHLAEEEDAYPAALRSSTMTREEEKVVVGKIVQGLGLDGNKVLLPPIIYAMHMWAGRDQAEAFVDALPPPIRFLFTRFWVHDFQVNSLGVIGALQGNEPYQPKQCDLCTVM